ncbi:hypothetical protein HMPREF0973_00802 [Prevotella veroralis F0319]|uniref:Uncharacterized protein n=1 Tax=Prevotella veroralis F0319 TaxID=649761 RepID=C9MMH2_9BACT|nr:hypothetical protein HMPREF0973_00802 [Prevotella veroralis F0319]
MFVTKSICSSVTLSSKPYSAYYVFKNISFCLKPRSSVILPLKET